jgi:hypothetical protein
MQRARVLLQESHQYGLAAQANVIQAFGQTSAVSRTALHPSDAAPYRVCSSS